MFPRDFERHYWRQASPAPTARAEGDTRPNVLFIAVDDLNDWVEPLGGHPQASTPNLRRLTERGVLFANAHAQGGSSASSRASVLLGLQPATSGIYDDSQDFRDNALLSQRATLPEHFSANGYASYGVGKIFHDAHFDPERFDVAGPVPGPGPYRYFSTVGTDGRFLADWGPSPFRDKELGDRQIANWAVEGFASGKLEPPFFFAVGFYRPHVPIYSPARFFERLPMEDLELPATLADDRADIPPIASELVDPHHRYSDIAMHKLKRIRPAVQAYLAATTYVDEQIGRVLAALDASPYADDTIIVLFSANGWHLSEKGHWGKSTWWEESTRVPLIVSLPGGLRGVSTDQPVGLVDLYPTLIELCALSPVSGLDGHSLVPLLERPDAVRDLPALTTASEGSHAIRSRRYRYIRYVDGSEELYDHRTDPNEWENLIDDPGREAVLVAHRRLLAEALER